MAILPVGMNPDSFEEHITILEQVQIVNKINVLRAACKFEPGVQADNAAKMLDSASKRGNGAKAEKDFPFDGEIRG